MKKQQATTAKSNKANRGQGLVEFAFVLPILLLILIAIFDFGRAVYAYSVVANCAREGARYGIIDPQDQQGIIDAVQNSAMGLDLAQLTVNITYPTTDTLKVEVSYNFQLITPLVAELVSDNGTLTLSSAATMYTGE